MTIVVADERVVQRCGDVRYLLRSSSVGVGHVVKGRRRPMRAAVRYRFSPTLHRNKTDQNHHRSPDRWAEPKMGGQANRINNPRKWDEGAAATFK